jgi:hypothetical protein
MRINYGYWHVVVAFNWASLLCFNYKRRSKCTCEIQTCLCNRSIYWTLNESNSDLNSLHKFASVSWRRCCRGWLSWPCMLVTAAEVMWTSLCDAWFHRDIVLLNLLEWTHLSPKLLLEQTLHSIDVRWRIVYCVCNRCRSTRYVLLWICLLHDSLPRTFSSFRFSNLICSFFAVRIESSQPFNCTSSAWNGDMISLFFISELQGHGCVLYTNCAILKPLVCA